jgi:hypothetical protein
VLVSKRKADNIMKRFIYIPLIAILTGMASCVEKNDAPPPEIPFEPGLMVTIDDVKELYNDELKRYWTDRTPVEITDDWSIKGIITADDKSTGGNYYKEAFIQDLTGGLQVKFASSGGLAVGDSVIINLQGLYLSDYGDFIQLGGQPYKDDSNNWRIEGMDKHKYLLRTSYNNELVPALVNISDIDDTYLGELIRLENVQFASNELGKTYATPEMNGNAPRDENRTLEDCNGKRIVVRTSGYANFAGDYLPKGNGGFIGIVTKFNTTMQLKIRFIDEVTVSNSMNDRCN